MHRMKCLFVEWLNDPYHRVVQGRGMDSHSQAASLENCQVYMRTYFYDHSLFVHPSCYSTGAESGGEPQARRSHGEIADEIPHQGDDLYNRRKQGENRTVKLRKKCLSAMVLYSSDDE